MAQEEWKLTWEAKRGQLWIRHVKGHSDHEWNDMADAGSPTTADAGKSKQMPGAPSTDARAPAYAIMCCCPLGSSIPGAPNRASGEALGVGGRRRRPANAGRSVQLLTQPTGGGRIWDIIV